MDFNERIQKAIERGKQRADEKVREERARQMNEDEFKSLHSKYRLQISEHIEQCVGGLPNHFPGFRYETIFGDRGWGAACFRDDLRITSSGRRENDYSRLEMTIRPYSNYHIVDLAAKGTIGNKEIFNRNHYEQLEQTDVTKFIELVDVWVLDYAEMYAARV